jgi:hypothetical protein
MGDRIMHMRNIKGNATAKVPRISKYMKRHYFKLWIDQFEDKPIRVFIDVENGEDVEEKLRSKIRWEKLKRTPRA